MSFNILITKLW